MVGNPMTDKTLAERLRDAEADEKRLTDELLRAYRAGEFWLTPCASVALDAKDAEIARLREALEPFDHAIRSARGRLDDRCDLADIEAVALRFIRLDDLKNAAAALRK